MSRSEVGRAGLLGAGARATTTVLGAVLCLGAAGAGACGSTPTEKAPAHLDIVIGSAGTKSSTLRPVYDWAVAAVNALGGAGGRRLEAEYIELSPALAASPADEEALATRMLGTPNLVAVAGLFAFPIAPALVAAKIPYLTPETGDDEVFRAFHEGGYVWRTLESNSTELWFMLAEAKGRGEMNQQATTTVGLLTSSDSYGATFFDWYGFHATELGLTALSPVQYDQDHDTCEAAVDSLLGQGVPDFLIAVPSGPDPVAQATCMVRTMKARGATSKVLLADSAHLPTLIGALGADAEGLAGYNAAPDPASGFSQAFTAKTGLAEPPEHAANTLDAIALLAYGLEKSAGVGGQALDAGMRAVVDGQGQVTSWSDFKQALSLIAAGASPDVSGASGPLSFDKDYYTDPTSSFYDRWVVKGGVFETTHHVTTETEASPNVYSRSAVARGLKTLQPTALVGASGGTADLPPLHENWALLIATSGTWLNYRHQADVLAQYQALKANGFDDAHVVLVTVDDLAFAPENPRKGQVVNLEGGPDVRAGAMPDYTGKSLTPEQLMTVLEGGNDPSLPAVLHSQANDNVYVLMVGHGGVEGPYLGLDASSASQIDAESYLSPSRFAATVARMKANGQFRRMFIAVDACHSGVLGPAFEAVGIPDVVLFAGAAPPESSFSANYSSQLQVWTADQFAYNLLQAVKSPTLSINALYTHLYEQVYGSHVQVANQQSFGDSTQIQLAEFVTRLH